MSFSFCLKCNIDTMSPVLDIIENLKSYDETASKKACGPVESFEGEIAKFEKCAFSFSNYEDHYLALPFVGLNSNVFVNFETKLRFYYTKQMV